MFYEVKLGEPRPDGLAFVVTAFGEPAGNDVLVGEAIRAIQALQLKGGHGILFNGPASLPVAMALAHAVAHLYQFVGWFDPKLGRFVVVISHAADVRPGDLLT